MQRNVSLQQFNTLAVPATAEYFSSLKQPQDLPALLARARDAQWPVRVLGEGSNVVLAERLDGLTIHQCCRGISVLEDSPDSVLVAVAAGENWHDFVTWCLQQGYHGLENLALIPGTVGAVPIQNVGAYGVEVSEFIEVVRCRRLATGEQLQLSKKDCQFDYRNSVFKGELRDQCIVEEVQFRLPKIPRLNVSYPALANWLEQQECSAPTPRQVYEAVVSIRRSRLPDPAEVPNAGSFFKNPQLEAAALEPLLEKYPDLPHYRDEGVAAPAGSYKLAAAWLIDYCGFRQRRDGPVQVHPQHALVLINPQRRGAAEIEQFAQEIVAAVEQEFGLQLEQEPRSYGL